MSFKEISGLLSITPESESPRDVSKGVVEGNVAFRAPNLRRTTGFWNANSQGSALYILGMPWKQAFLLNDNDMNIGHGILLHSGGNTYYPYDPSGSGVTMTSVDYLKFRVTGSIGTIGSANVPRVMGSVAAWDNSYYQVSGHAPYGDGVVSVTDVPLEYTQIGIVYAHPMTVMTSVTTAVGQQYVTYTNASTIDSISRWGGGNQPLLRIETGPDAGMYRILHNDSANNRMYLMHLDGTIFVGQSAGTYTTTIGPGRRAFFNETSIIPLSVGTMATGGRFNPRKDDPHLRESFILRAYFDKTGSTEAAAGTEQQGSYWLSLKPYLYGDGSPGDTHDDNGNTSGSLGTLHGGITNPFKVNYWAGGFSGMVLDWEGQKLWFGYSAGGQSGIGYWRYKTCESFHEVANYLGTPAHPELTPTPTLGTGDTIYGAVIGSNRWVYMAVWNTSGGNGGLIIIKPDMTTLQYKVADGVPDFRCDGVQVDNSRTRTGTAGDVSTNGADQVTSASGSFTNADIGRAIKLTGLGADNGTYKIATIVSGTQVTVTTMADAGVTFTSQSGGTFEIGDRVYLLFSDGVVGAGKMNYMEALVPGTFLQRVVSMTGGATADGWSRRGQKQLSSIDQANGCVYWISDGKTQINKYDPSTNTHSRLVIADVQSPSGGTGTISNITGFQAIHVNTKFDEIWVGTDQGHVKIVKSTFAGATAKRYFGTEATTYHNPAGYPRTSGTGSTNNNTNFVRFYVERPDGRMDTVLQTAAGTSWDRAVYSRETDSWCIKDDFITPSTTSCMNLVCDPYGRMTGILGEANTQYWSFITFGVEVQYQWDNANSKWIPLEFIRGGLPNKSISDNSAPYAKAKPIHSTLEDTLFGVKIRFDRQGGATPANNEFLGICGQTRITATDGSTTTGTGTFGGSAFAVGDVGRILRIESGADVGIYKISAFTNATTITLTKLNGTAFSATATAGTLTYTVWDFGTPGSNAGPEICSVLLADGFGKDNTQDFSGISYEYYGFKTRLHEFDEPIKFAVYNPLPVPGSTSLQVFKEDYLRASPQYFAALSHHKALPGSPVTNGDQLLAHISDHYLNGVVGKANLPSVSTQYNWFGISANTSVHGTSVMVDFGAEVDVGYVQVRMRGFANPHLIVATQTNCGLICNLYNAPAGSAPADSSSIRTSGTTNVSAAINGTTLTLGSGDFLGAIRASGGPYGNGSIVSGQSTFSDTTNAPFTSNDVGNILKITAGAGGDNGSYRIIGYTSASTVTIRSLDQTDKVWAGSASSITYEIRDGVREEDMIAIPSLASPTHRLCIERLLTETTAQVRTGPNAAVTNQSWQCISPSWRHVKRVSFSSEAQPPDVKNNGTWVSLDGAERYDNQDSKIFMDLTDLPASRRTGRYFKMSFMPRFGGTSGTQDWYFSTMEFYDTSGNKLALSKYTQTDESRTNADFFFNHINRFDWIQSSNSAVGGSFNGNADLGGANGDTITPTTGGNKFLGFQIGKTVTDGALSAGTNAITSALSSFPASAIVGRFIRILSGANAGNFYRVISRVSATQITVSTPSGGSVLWGGTESSIQFSIHEGINVGGTYPDKFVFTEDQRELSILSINDTLTQITISESRQPSRTNKAWEIRRPGYDTSSATTEVSKPARLVRPGSTFPVQSGDLVHNSRGTYRLFDEDIVSGAARTDGTIAGGNNTFSGSGFSQDDVGRLLFIDTGVNKGVYEIETFSTATTITVKNHYTGAAVTLTADAGPITYRVIGDRRFRISKLVVGLRN